VISRPTGQQCRTLHISCFLGLWPAKHISRPHYFTYPKGTEELVSPKESAPPRARRRRMLKMASVYAANNEGIDARRPPWLSCPPTPTLIASWPPIACRWLATWISLSGGLATECLCPPARHISCEFRCRCNPPHNISTSLFRRASSIGDLLQPPHDNSPWLEFMETWDHIRMQQLCSEGWHLAVGVPGNAAVVSPCTTASIYEPVLHAAQGAAAQLYWTCLPESRHRPELGFCGGSQLRIRHLRTGLLPQGPAGTREGYHAASPSHLTVCNAEEYVGKPAG